MNFEQVLDQAIDMLHRRGRLTYRTLKRQFELDDEALADLSVELIKGQKLARDEGGEVLVWIGEAPTPPQHAQPEADSEAEIHETSSSQIKLRPSDIRAPEAERRQLTVMFCDLVGSTALSGELDPEDLRDIVKAYQDACTGVVQRYEGYVAQLLGDGLLIYYGYPQAHEDDAQRAIHAGLGILKAIATLNNALKQTRPIGLSVRLGIHTGLVVVGGMGGEGRQEQLALGETPNVAARLQGLAEPDTMVISADTYRLIKGYFDCESLGERDLRGVSQGITVYRVLQESGAQSRLDISGTRGLTPLIGRESETTLLFERWAQARNSNGQVVLLSGEAGIGKSRLLQALIDHVANEPHLLWECRSSSYFANSALYPVIEIMQRTLGWHKGDTPDERLVKLEHHLRQYRLPLEESVPLFAALLSLPIPEEQYLPLTLSPQIQRQKTLAALLAVMLESAEPQPVLFILEDLHWTDPTTLEFLGLLIDQSPTATVCVLLTCRPDFQSPWSSRSYLTQMTLNRLSQPQIVPIAEHIAGGKRLPAVVLEHITEKTDGVPLYVEEMTKAVLESGSLKDVDGQYELNGSISTLSIPATLQDSLMARLDRLVTAKGVAQYASVIGRQFSYDLLQAVCELDEAMLQHELSRLVEAELVYQRGLPPQATYLFKHALIRDSAYASLLRSTRQGYHRRIAEVLTARFPEVAESQPELMAHHFTQAGLNDGAIGYWHQAADRARQRSAYVEANAHLATALELLTSLPDTAERTQHELTFHLIQGRIFIATKGYGAPEVQHAFTRAYELSQKTGELPQRFSALVGLWNYYVVGSELQRSHELAEQIMSLAQRWQGSWPLLVAHNALGQSLRNLRQFRPARSHFEQGITLYNSQQHRPEVSGSVQDIGVTCYSYLAFTLQELGYLDQAVHRSHEALRLARELAHLYSLTASRFWAATLYRRLRAVHSVREHADALIALSKEHGFDHWLVQGRMLRGWTLTMQGQRAEGMAQIHQGLHDLRTLGREVLPGHTRVLVAEAYGVGGYIKEGLAVVAEALTCAGQHEEYFYQDQLLRLKGELLLQQTSDNSEEAETCFQQAISIAQNQSAKCWELRASTSLARLWQSQGKRQEAYDLLAPVYAWFTEGFDTADLQEAKALLVELSE